MPLHRKHVAGVVALTVGAAYGLTRWRGTADADSDADSDVEDADRGADGTDRRTLAAARPAVR